MAIDKKDKNNILLNQIDVSGYLHLKELVPNIIGDEGYKFLHWNDELPVWKHIKGSENIYISTDENGNLIIDSSIDYFTGTDMYFNNTQIGIGRLPLYNYKVDIGVPRNTRMTALHIGDGLFGFSLGNATETGFLPQIIGMGSDEDDAGLYFLGKTSSSEASPIPAIIFDGRDITNNPLENRPIMGISSGSYTEYKFLIDSQGNVNISGNLNANNIIILDSSNNTQNLRNEIEELKLKITELISENYSMKNRISNLENIDSSI